MALLIIPVRELEVRTATYGPGIDQSQQAKSVSHIINKSYSGQLGKYGIYSGHSATRRENTKRVLGIAE